MSSFTQRGISLLLSLEERVLPYLKKRGVRAFLVALGAFGGIFLQHATVSAQTSSPSSTDSFFLFVADVAIGFAGMIGTFIVALLEIVTIPIMQYNGFVSSPVVGAGWSIVRDTVNMFFVAVLLFIAIATIFGASVGGNQISWRQSVPRLMVFAIVINFSRTLCGLMIDVSQVIMLTFANALKDIAGGNFIQVFGLKDLISVSTSSDRMQALAGGAGAEALNAFDYLTAGVMSVFLMLIVFVVVLMLTAILVYRIVALWILIVIAPLAWFLGGAKGVISSDAYAEWWKNFKCYLLIGPVLTFFVWLTLAVAGAGNIANSAGFTSGAVLSSGADTNVVGGALKIFEVSRLTSYIIGIALMFAGFDAAQKMCAGVKSAGFINNRIDTMRGSPSMITGAGMAAAGGAAYLGAKGLGAAGSAGGAVWNGLGTNLSPRVQNTPLDLLTKQGRARRARSAAATTNSPFFARKAGAYADALEKAHSEEIKASTEGYGFESMGKGSKVEFLAAMAQSGQPILQGDKNSAMVLFAEMIGDAKKRKALEDRKVTVRNPDGSTSEVSALKKLYQDFGSGNLKAAFGGDEHLSHSLHDFEESRPDIAGTADHIGDMDGVRKLDKAAFEDPTVRERLKKIASGTVDEKGREVYAYDFVANGRLGIDKQKALGLPKDIAAFVAGGGIDAATARFSDDEAKKRFASMVQKNPEQIMDIPDNLLRNADGKPTELARAAAQGVNDKNISLTFDEYLRADVAERPAIEARLNRMRDLIDVAGQTASDPLKHERIAKRFDQTRARVRDIADPAAANARRISAQREQDARDAAGADEARQAIQRIQTRLQEIATARRTSEEARLTAVVNGAKREDRMTIGSPAYRAQRDLDKLRAQMVTAAEAQGEEADRLRAELARLNTPPAPPSPSGTNPRNTRSR